MRNADQLIETRAIWLLVLREGGHWPCREIAAELGVTGDLVSRYISTMAARGFVRRHDGSPLKYSVDKNCRIPMDVTLADLMDAGVQV
jgi:predicted transcriptional regulator